MSQYFSNDPNIKSKEIHVKYTINSKEFELLSDNGVFSKAHIDQGTTLLIKTCLKQELSGKILDLGCAIGTVGLTLASFNDANLYTLVDINERAVELAKKNISRLNLSSSCEALVSDIFSSLDDRKFDYILLNPPIRAGKKVIYKMYEDALSHLYSSGSLFIVIRIKQGALSTFKYLLNIYKEVKVIAKDKGYQIIQAIK